MAKPKGSRWIPLTQGQRALVDAADYEWLMRWKWCARKTLLRSGEVYYALRREALSGRMLYMHREIMAARKGEEVDHKHGNRLDNRRSELRIATRVQNAQNIHRVSTWKATTAKGVYRCMSGRWRTQIGVDGRQVHLGYYSTEYEAALVYDEAARVYFGEFAATNAMLGLL